MNTTCTYEESTANPSDSAETIFWLKLTMTSVLMLFLIPCILFDIQERLTRRRRKAMILPALKKLKADYANMSSTERGKVETCKTKIMTVLGPDQPGRDKYIDAWGQWSREEAFGSGTIGIVFKSSWFRDSVSTNVEKYMGVAEVALQSARGGKRRLAKAMRKTEEAARELEMGDPKANKKHEKAVKREDEDRRRWEGLEKEMVQHVENAALLWAIFWPEEVEKERAKQAASKSHRQSKLFRYSL